MIKPLSDSRLANLGANTIFFSFQAYQAQFCNLTKKARQCFIEHDWPGMYGDSLERLKLYKRIVNEAVAQIQEMLNEKIEDKLIWASIKAVYSSLIAERDEWELAETFFNSITRRIFATVGLDPQIEFVDSDFDMPPTRSKAKVYCTYDKHENIESMLEEIVQDYGLGAEFEDLKRDTQLATRLIEQELVRLGAEPKIDRAEMVKSVFYRNKGAYLVGRIFNGGLCLPFVLAILHPSNGLVIDGVLLNEDEVGILFSFTRSYFHVEASRPYDLVRFLKTLLPRKRRAELYISIGYNKHGKTELYRDLLNHLEASNDHFVLARGIRGMVMIVFTLPSFEVVVKIIKDRFDEPKTMTRRQVMAQYNLVFEHDRAGRLVDAQEFEHLKFERNRFSEELLQELLQVASKTVCVKGDYVIIDHAYIERRVTPLNLYIQETDLASAKAAVIECGNAIKDLAATNIFTGDMLLKNFGVTRHGRVVFYDYDELSSITSCNFRLMPQASNDDEEMAADPWFSVGENDVFPEEFTRFLGLSGELRKTFVEYHEDLFKASFWQQLQTRLKQGEIIDIFPYQPSSRLLSLKEGQPEAAIAFSSVGQNKSFNTL